MIGRSIEAIEERDLTALVANKVREGRDLEYKCDLPSDGDPMPEFLRDLTALANAQGGDLIFGIEDRKGMATGVPGVGIDDADGEMQRLENIIRDCV